MCSRPFSSWPAQPAQHRVQSAYRDGSAKKQGVVMGQGRDDDMEKCQAYITLHLIHVVYMTVLPTCSMHGCSFHLELLQSLFEKVVWL